MREHIVLAGLRKEKKFTDSYSSIMEGKNLSASIKAQQDLEEQAERNKKVVICVEQRAYSVPVSDTSPRVFFRFGSLTSGTWKCTERSRGAWLRSSTA